MDVIHALLIEDNPGDARLVQEYLRESAEGVVKIGWSQTFADGMERLSEQPMDVVLLDLSLPDSDGLATLTKLSTRHPRLPVVVLTGHEDESNALRAMRYGAQDYLVKGQLSGRALLRAMRFAIERARAMHSGQEPIHSLASDLRRHLDLLQAEHTALERLLSNPGAGSGASPGPVGEGSVLHERYALHELLGHGSYGRAFRANDKFLDRRVVVKLLHAGLADGAEGERQFMKEARLLASLDHARVVRVHDFGFHEKMPFYVMEYAEGASLASLLAKEGKPAPDLVIKLLDQVLDGLDYIHARGVLHRDLKPANILLTGEKDAKLGDFGMALMKPTDATVQNLGLGATGGTPAYAAPEALLSRPLSPASDIYGVGTILFEMIAGGAYHTARQAGKQEPMRALKAATAAVPEEVAKLFVELCQQALDRQPAQRFQSARAMRQMLHDRLLAINPAERGGGNGRRQ